MSTLISQLLAPGGGVMLIPFIRYVIMLLLLVTSTAFILGVARIHMAILSFLSGGLLVSITLFQSEYDKVMAARAGHESTPQSEPEPEKSEELKKTD